MLRAGLRPQHAAVAVWDALRPSLEFVLAAGLLRLAAHPGPLAVGAAAAIVLIRKVATTVAFAVSVFAQRPAEATGSSPKR